MLSLRGALGQIGRPYEVHNENRARLAFRQVERAMGLAIVKYQDFPLFVVLKLIVSKGFRIHLIKAR